VDGLRGAWEKRNKKWQTTKGDTLLLFAIFKLKETNALLPFSLFTHFPLLIIQIGK
jgi:hypothetical protein